MKILLVLLTFTLSPALFAKELKGYPGLSETPEPPNTMAGFSDKSDCHCNNAGRFAETNPPQAELAKPNEEETTN